jgi:hypothetical protein
LATGDAGSAVQDVGKFINQWHICQRVLSQCCSLLGEDLTQRRCGGELVRVRLDEVVDRLGEVRGALEARDMVLLADVVRYEMPELSKTWQALLGELADQVGPTSS